MQKRRNILEFVQKYMKPSTAESSEDMDVNTSGIYIVGHSQSYEVKPKPNPHFLIFGKGSK